MSRLSILSAENLKNTLEIFFALFANFLLAHSFSSYFLDNNQLGQSATEQRLSVGRLIDNYENPSDTFRYPMIKR